MAVSATATRVAVLHGHLESVSVELETPATPDDARRAWDELAAWSARHDLDYSPPESVRAS